MNELLAWLNRNSAVVMAIATCFIAVFTIVLALATIRYVRLVKQQLDMLRERDEERTTRAIRAVVAEVEANADALEGQDQGGVLHSGAYPSSSWALAEVPAGSDAVPAIRAAHLRVETYNIQCMGAAMGTGVRVTALTTNAREKARAAVSQAMAAIEEDAVLKPFLSRSS